MKSLNLHVDRFLCYRYRCIMCTYACQTAITTRHEKTVCIMEFCLSELLLLNEQHGQLLSALLQTNYHLTFSR